MSDHRADTATPGLDEETKQFIVAAVREAIDLDNFDSDDDYKSWHQEQMALALKKHDDQYFRSTRLLIKEAVNEAIKEGQLKFDEKQLRGQVHQVLNTRLEPLMREILRKHDLGMSRSRTIEMTRVINSAFNRKLAEAGYLVAQEFMESDSVRNRLVGSTNESLETFFDDPDTKALLSRLIKEAVEEVLEDELPVQHVVQNFTPQALSASEIMRQSRGLLSSNSIRQAKKPEPEVVDFDRICHSDLGNWAAANDLTQVWQYDTNVTRNMLRHRQETGRLIWPGEDEPRG